MGRTLVIMSLGAALCAGMALAANPAAGDTDGAPPTFYQDVLPIVQQSCQSCHRPAGLNLGGMIAPMPFVTCEDARPWAKSIARLVAAREMPPGHAGPEYHGVFQMHYHKEPGPGTEVWDRSSAAIKLADQPVKRLHITPVGDPRKLYVPANTKDVYITSDDVVPRDIVVVSLLPHMHLRGSYARYVAFLPDGSEREFLEVPKYDFNWQTSYELAEHVELPAGTRIEVTCGYDNTADNPNNPDPTIDVRWGDATTDEMNLGWMTWAWKDGDDSDLERSFGEGRDRSAFGRGSGE